jgi:hypothetical protein
MKFPTIVLAAGAAILLIAVAVGQRMGDRVMQQATEQQQLQSVLPTPLPSGADASPQPYGPDWKRSQSLSAAADPRFPDPRVPPKPLPTLPPAPKATLPPPLPATPTPNPNIPIWRQKPLPTFMPSPEPSSGAAASPEADLPGATPTPP